MKKKNLIIITAIIAIITLITSIFLINDRLYSNNIALESLDSDKEISEIIEEIAPNNSLIDDECPEDFVCDIDYEEYDDLSYSYEVLPDGGLYTEVNGISIFYEPCNYCGKSACDCPLCQADYYYVPHKDLDANLWCDVCYKFIDTELCYMSFIPSAHDDGNTDGICDVCDKSIE